MAKFDEIVTKKSNFKGYTGNPPTNETEYNSMKTNMFDGEIPTWSEIKSEMDNFVSSKQSGKQKLKDLGLDDDEIQALIGV
tara:strand:+ start:556 stop:798 length:243 start_codon:yes stop_codon:yes gene_type:complete